MLQSEALELLKSDAGDADFRYLGGDKGED